MNEPTHYTPPRLAATLLNWLLEDHWDTPLGDYEEFYNALAAAQGERKARWWYRGQVLRLLPDQLYEKAYWGLLMLKNYLLLGVRTLRKNKVPATINLVGLAAALGVAIMIFLFIQEINTYDDFHEHGARVYLVGHVVDDEGEDDLWGTAPMPLGPALAADFPQVEQVVRVATRDALVQGSGSVFQETVSFADPGFFDMLTFPLVQGQAAALTDPSAVILSATMAAKYFPGQDPMGQVLAVTFDNGVAEALTVRGVAQAFPRRTSMKFDFLVGYAKLRAAGVASLEDWSLLTDGTFVKLRQAQDASLLAEQLDRYVPAQNEADEARPVQSFFLDNIQHPDLTRAWAIHDRAMLALPLWESVGFGLVGLLVLLISCFNYITIALGSAARRLKEIGIRKTAGAEKRQLVQQFLTENLLLCFGALLGGLFLAWAVVLPFMYELTSMQLRLDLTANAGLWVFLVGLLAFVGLVSGAYPAFYIASFPPAQILRGKQKLAQKKGLTRTLTTVQFVLTIITISLSLFLVSLDDTLTGKDWGYAADQTLVVPGLNPTQYARLHAEATQLAQVEQVAGAAHHIGASRSAVTVQVEGSEKQALYYGVGPTYLATMGLQVAAGHAFGADFRAEDSRSVVVNQTFAHEQGWDDPVGQPLRIDDRAYAVVGVVDDFLVSPYEGTAVPVVFGLAEATQYTYLTMRVPGGASDPAVDALQASWAAQFPEVDFAYYTQTEVFEEYDLILNLSIQFTRYLGLFALLISCMGLFGMASQRAAQRIKEVGIRKAMGASATQVVLLVNRGFLVMLVVATLIATPLCYVGLSALLSLAPIEIPLGIAPFVWSNVLVFAMAALSLSMQTSALIKVNPADVLRRD